MRLGTAFTDANLAFMLALYNGIKTHEMERVMARFSARLIPAMVTPFTTDGLAVDLAAVDKLVPHLVHQGCDGLLVNGTTGESPTLNHNEKTQLIRHVQGLLQNEPTQLMVCIGGNNTAEAVEKTQQAVQQFGIKTLLVVVPYYNKPSQEGMFQHFKAVAQGVPGAEVMIYNIPGRCGVEMQPETMARLKETCANIIGVKQSVASMETASHITRLLAGSDWRIWSGDDPITHPMMACGAYGVVSVLAHLTPTAIRQMIDAFNAGDWTKAQAIHLELLPLAQGLFTLPNPTITKTLLAELGLVSPALRLPMVPPNASEKATILQWLPVIEDINRRYALITA